MLIVCPNCETSYRVEPSSLGDGRSVRCVRCRSVWFAVAAAEPSLDAGPGEADWAAPMPVGEPFAAAEPEPAETIPEPPSPTGPKPDETDPDHDAGRTWSPSPRTEFRFEAEPPISQDTLAVAAPAAANSRQGVTASIKDVLDDVESFAARRLKRQKQRRGQWSAPVLPTAIMVLLAANIILIGWRSDVVKILPQTASLYGAIGLPVNLRGLAFSDVKSMTESHDGVPVLVVEGTIAATTKRVVEVPRLRISLRNASGHEVYAWTALPGRSVLSPGESFAFQSRLASPPADGHDVIVRFFNRRDMVAGLQ